MIKLTNVYLVGIIASTLLVGCGGNDSSGGDDGLSTIAPTTTTTTTTTTAPTTTSTSKKFGADVMPILISQCKSCHGSNGRFTITSTSSTYNNISALKSPVTTAGQYLLDKASGAIGHGGGVRFSASSTQYATIKSWIDAGAQNN